MRRRVRRRTGDSNGDVLTENQRDDLRALRSERHTDADLAGAARGAIGERAIEPDGGDEQRAGGEEHREHGHHALGGEGVVQHLAEGIEDGSGDLWDFAREDGGTAEAKCAAGPSRRTTKV